MPMLDVYIPMMTSAALAAAGRIGLFDRLADGASDVATLSTALGADRHAVESLVDLLVATGHLERHAGGVANAPRTLRWFTSRGAVDYGAGLTWTTHAWGIMDDLPMAIRRGGPERLLWNRMAENPELGVSFASYMEAFARHLSPDLLALPNIPSTASRLLDLGGSHGLHSKAFCDRYPNLSAVIVDLESALVGTKARLEAEGLGSRIDVRPGDLRSCDWGDGYDIALYLSVGHNMGVDDNRAILRRLREAMRPGGTLIIHDYPRETTPALFEAAFRLTLLVETGTRTYTCAEWSDMVEEAGFAAHRAVVLSPAQKGTLIVARR